MVQTLKIIKRETFLPLIAILCLLFAISSASAATNVSGTISSDTTWTLADSPFVLEGTVTVSTGVTLTLQPGVVVKGNYNPSYSSVLLVNGTLVADGTAAQPIVFTSFRDDSFGGDTNGDGSATVPAKGDWIGLAFYGSSTGNVLDNVVVRYGGYWYGNANRNIYTNTSGLAISASSPW